MIPCKKGCLAHITANTTSAELATFQLD